MIKAEKRLIFEKKPVNFKATSGWNYRFLARKKLMSTKLRGDTGLLGSDDIERQKFSLQKTLCVWSLSNISNKDEVGVLFRSFRSRSVN